MIFQQQIDEGHYIRLYSVVSRQSPYLEQLTESTGTPLMVAASKKVDNPELLSTQKHLSSLATVDSMEWIVGLGASL